VGIVIHIVRSDLS